MLGHRRRRCPNIKTTLGQSLVFAGSERLMVKQMTKRRVALYIDHGNRALQFISKLHICLHFLEHKLMEYICLRIKGFKLASASAEQLSNNT